jgi:hypothetical protein
MTSMRVALVTCVEPPEADVDEELLVSALRRAGLDARMVAWDAPHAERASRELFVLRSTWNYAQHFDAFCTWLRTTARHARLLNPLHVVSCNLQKTYLRSLEAQGIAIVPTEFVARGDRRSLDDLRRHEGWNAIVVKPVVSGGSYRTARFDGSAQASWQDAQAFLDALLADRDAMVQPWMPSVETSGERSLVWIDGAFTHAIRKAPRFAGEQERVSEALVVEADEQAFGETVLGAFVRDADTSLDELLYARVDVLRDETGDLRLMELELVEPSLYLSLSPDALARFVAATARAATRRDVHGET